MTLIPATGIVAPLRQPSARWRTALLLVLAVPPLGFGAAHLVALASAGMPTGLVLVPLWLHVGGAALYALVGAFQFAPKFRQRWPQWHRRAGRALVGGGLVVALSGLGLTLAYASPDPAGLVLAGFRLIFGSAMLTSILFGLAAIRRRDVARHRAHMMRAYAIGLGAGTQMLVLMLAEIVAGPPADLTRSTLMGVAWMINLAVAERLIGRARLGRRA